MDSPLLSTKYTLPPNSAQRVERFQLLQKLDAAWRGGKRLILVCAPAGYGKTTLVGDWAHRMDTRGAAASSAPERAGTSAGAAWLTCEPEDSDLARFLPYLVAALRQVNPRIGGGVLATFIAAKPPTPQTLATLLINDLAQIPGRFLLVLDDFHTISSQPIHDFLAYLIEHQSPGICLVLVTREDPPLPLARLRARGQMEEIRQDGLAFTLQESADFLSQMGVALTPDQLAALESRTEGWAAGLQLAALSMRTAPDLSAFISAFSGGHEYIAGYLVDEVLGQQSDSIQSFLLQTSILERLTAPLCAAVTGDADAAEILETLREKNLFLIPLDHEKECYRYHALFAGLLRKRLVQSRPDQVGELYLRASRWYQGRGLLQPAIEAALAGHAAEHAAVLLEQTVEPVFIAGQVNTLLRWLELLPVEIKNRHSILWIFHGLALIWGGLPPAAVKPFLPGLASIFGQDGLSGEAHTLQALYAMIDGVPAEAVRLADIAMQELSPQRALFRCLAADTLGLAHILQSETPAAVRAFELLAETASQAGYGMFEIISLSHLAGLHLQQGHLNAAEIGYRRALELALQKLGQYSPVSGNIILGLGELARERNDLDGALHYFSESAAMFAQFGEMGVPIAELSMARVKISQGDWESGQEYLAKARRHPQASQAPEVGRLNERLVNGLQARLWIMRGELGLAEQWARDSGLIARSISDIFSSAGQRAAGSEFVHNDYLTLARLYLAQNKPAAALEVINSLLSVAGAVGYMRRVIQILVLKALALQQMRQGPPAVDALGQALALAEPEGYLRVFLDEGELIVPILYQAVERGIAVNYVKKILAVFPHYGFFAAAPGEKKLVDSLLEPLSDREIEVLVLIAAGLSNRDISARLHISLSTVKGHSANIYGKLGVNTRVQAISEAARLGILTRRG